MTDRLARALDRAGAARLIPGNAVRHLPDSAAALDAMLELIAGARRTVHFENYIIRSDRTGRRFAAALSEKARAGVRVRVLYDALGSVATRWRFWRDLRRAGADVRAFRPLLTSGPFEVLSRDHRKLIVVDGREAMLGGLCIGDEWAGDPDRARQPWRDTMVAVCGPAVAALEGSFARVWARAGPPLPPDALAPPPTAESCGSSALRVIDGVPGQSRAYRAVQLLAAAAEERLWITDAYMVAPPPLYASLVDAAKSGVDVRLLLPGTSDIPVVRTFSRIGYRDLLRAGARIFEYGGPMLHAKTLLVDREWARVGSTNLNVSSLMGNYELDIVAECDSLTEALAAQFRHDAAYSREIVLLERRRLPARLVRGPSPPALTGPHRRTRRELQAAAAIALVQVAGGARRMVAGALAVTLALLGALLIVFPTASSVVLATGALAAALGLAFYALVRRRHRRQADAA
ncbi:MAG TPA: phospholipase D-like domain-containing protein [Gemmatimonadales bacterium]